MTQPSHPLGFAAKEVSKSCGLTITESKGSMPPGKCRKLKIIAVTSGKGGVGKTNITANLAMSLSELGRKIVILDADFGLANIDILMGLNPQYNLGNVLFGNKTLNEIMVKGPNGIRIIPSSSGLERMTTLTLEQRNHLVENFEMLDADIDYLIIDTAAGISRNVIHFLLSAQEVIVVSAPEPMAMVDAYAMIKIILSEDHEKQIQILINSVKHASEGQAVFDQMNSVVKRFFKRELDYLGHIKSDPHVSQAVQIQGLVTQCFPNAPASRCFRRIARRIARQETPTLSSFEFVWNKLLNNWIN